MPSLLGWIDHRRPWRTQLTSGLALREERGDPRVTGHEGKPFGGIRRIEGDVARAHCERGQHADDHLDVALGGDPDPVATCDAGRTEPTGERTALARAARDRRV